MKLSEKVNNLKLWLNDKLSGKSEIEMHTIEDLEEHAEIPEAYLAKFSLDAVKDPTALLGRDEELQLVEKAYSNWKISKNLLLMVGETGAGMSSIINVATTNIENVITIENSQNISAHSDLLKILSEKLGVSNCQKLAELHTVVSQEPRVIVFENIERLFIRTINGFNLLDEFLLLMHNTKHHIFWIVTVNKYSFYYLNQVKAIAENFLSLIRINPLKDNIVQQVMDERNKSNQNYYLKPLLAAKSYYKKLKKEDITKVQAMLEERFKKNLLAFAGGNLSRAMLYWKKAIVRVSETKVYIREISSTKVPNLTLDELFILDAILQHTSLSATELKKVLRNSERASTLTLEKLKERDLIVAMDFKNTEHEYRINLFYLNEVVVMLKERLNRKFV